MKEKNNETLRLDTRSFDHGIARLGGQKIDC
jgi:hypothetical protein